MAPNEIITRKTEKSSKSVDLGAIASKHNINLIEHRTRDNRKWPADHREVFRRIDDIAQSRYHRYGIIPDTDAYDNAPWKLETKQLARLLVQEAIKAKNEAKNEAGWRDRVETLLISRFRIRVACRKCRGRLWRSEFEVPDSEERTQTSEGRSNHELPLSDRQQARKPCKCLGKERLSEDFPEDENLNSLFADRLEELIEFDEELKGKLEFRMRPDRIVGLAKTEVLAHALDQEYAHGESPHQVVKNVVNSTPFARTTKSPSLYPFLIMESKAGKNGQTLDHAIEQSLLPLRTLLHLQHSLQETHGNKYQLRGGPLVWCLAYQGSDWRLYGSWIDQRESGERSYVVCLLWDGNITSDDDALQLILILDFIADWARDSFRRSIIKQLKSLGRQVSRAETVSYVDDDISSLRGSPIISQSISHAWTRTLSVERERHQPQHLGTHRMRKKDPTSQLRMILQEIQEQKIDSEYGIVRSARQVATSLRGLLITNDNITTLLKSAKDNTEEMALMKSLLQGIKENPLILHCFHDLSQLEQSWTNHSSDIPDWNESPKHIYMTFSISFYIDHKWRIHRELAYLAITDRAHKYLELATGASAPRYMHKPVEMLIKWISDFRKASPEETLALAANRISYIMPPFVLVRRPEESLKTKLLYDQVYRMTQIGRREPSESFLRFSIQLDELSADTEDPSRFDKQDIPEIGKILNMRLPPDAKSVMMFGFRSIEELSTETISGELCLVLLNDTIADFNRHKLVDELCEWTKLGSHDPDETDDWGQIIRIAPASDGKPIIEDTSARTPYLFGQIHENIENFAFRDVITAWYNYERPKETPWLIPSRRELLQQDREYPPGKCAVCKISLSGRSCESVLNHITNSIHEPVEDWGYESDASHGPLQKQKHKQKQRRREEERRKGRHSLESSSEKEGDAYVCRNVLKCFRRMLRREVL